MIEILLWMVVAMGMVVIAHCSLILTELRGIHHELQLRRPPSDLRKKLATDPAGCLKDLEKQRQEDVSGPSFEDLARGLDKEQVEPDGSFIYCVEAADDKPYADGRPYDKLPCYDCSVCGKRYRMMVAARECCKKDRADEDKK